MTTPDVTAHSKATGLRRCVSVRPTSPAFPSGLTLRQRWLKLAHIPKGGRNILLHMWGAVGFGVLRVIRLSGV